MKGNTWKHSLATLVVVAAAGLLAQPALAAVCHCETVDLQAGRDRVFVGTVTVCNDENGALTVTLSTVGGWIMTASHVHANSLLPNFPQNNGGLIPGQFSSKIDPHSPPVTQAVHSPSGTFTIGSTIWVAAHADVVKNSDTAGAWGQGTSVGRNISMAFPFALGACANEGCSHGYWKNHTSAWPSPYGTFSVLGGNFDNGYLNAIASSLPSTYFTTALDFRGGSGVLGGAQILLRNAVASLLNAAHPDVNYPMTVQAVKNAVDTALASGDRATMLALEAQLDVLNNLGCPLD